MKQIKQEYFSKDNNSPKKDIPRFNRHRTETPTQSPSPNQQLKQEKQ